MWGEVASKLSSVLNDDTFRSLEGKTKHQLWLELCDVVTRHPRDVEGSGVDVEAVLRGGIRRYTDEVGRGAPGRRGGGVKRQTMTGAPPWARHGRPRCTGDTCDPQRPQPFAPSGGAPVDVAGGLLHPARHV